MKLEDIPHDVWETAVSVTTGTMAFGSPRLTTEIARAIMAAEKRGEEREREATLDAASSYLEEQYGYGILSHPVDRARIAAIRNRGKP